MDKSIHLVVQMHVPWPSARTNHSSIENFCFMKAPINYICTLRYFLFTFQKELQNIYYSRNPTALIVV